jgi:hypothetical protein
MTAAPSRALPVRRLLIVKAVDVVERPIEWVWRYRILRRALNLIEGHPEAGKSASAIDLLARLSRGAPLPDGEPCEPQRISILGAEDELESVVRPRLRVAGADLSLIHFITGALSAGCAVKDRITLPADRGLLAEAMQDRDLLYVDKSVNDLAAHGVRPGDDMAFRELLGALGDLASETGCTVVATRHGRKGGSREPLEFGSGTMGGTAKARSVIGVYRDPSDPERRLFARVKCNVAPAAPTLAFRCASDGRDAPLCVEWLGAAPARSPQPPPSRTRPWCGFNRATAPRRPPSPWPSRAHSGSGGAPAPRWLERSSGLRPGGLGRLSPPPSTLGATYGPNT